MTHQRLQSTTADRNKQTGRHGGYQSFTDDPAPSQRQSSWPAASVAQGQRAGKPLRGHPGLAVKREMCQLSAVDHVLHSNCAVISIGSASSCSHVISPTNQASSAKCQLLGRCWCASNFTFWPVRTSATPLRSRIDGNKSNM